MGIVPLVREVPGGTTLYKPKRYSYVLPKEVWFLRRFGLKNGCIDFSHFGLEPSMLFERTTGVYEGICSFKKE